jgi:hypothetical protein
VHSASDSKPELLQKVIHFKRESGMDKKEKGIKSGGGIP